MAKVQSSPQSRQLAPRGALFVVLLCWSVVVFDGYDLTVYGAVLPKIQGYWNLSSEAAGGIGSMAFLGMLIGALLAGRIADAIGRRKAILWCIVVFSVFTVACALSPSWVWFAVFRLLSGIGLGGVVPSANAMVAESVKPKHRGAVSTIMMSGIPIGGVLAAVLGLVLMNPQRDDAGNLLVVNDWHNMFYVAILGLIVMLPLAFFMLPESEEFKAAQANARIAAEVDSVAAGSPAEFYAGPKFNPGWRGLFDKPYIAASILFAVTTTAVLFTWYGLGTWLPKLMMTLSGGSFDAGLGFSLALNLGAVAGSIITAIVSIKVGPLKTATVASLVAAAGLFLLLIEPGGWLNYAIFVVAGVGTHGTQCLILGAISSFYPTRLRGSALGWSMGLGRIGAVVAPQIGGLLLAWAGPNNQPTGVRWNFIMFGAMAALATVLLFVTNFLKPVDEDKIRADHLAAARAAGQVPESEAAKGAKSAAEVAGRKAAAPAPSSDSKPRASRPAAGSDAPSHHTKE